MFFSVLQKNKRYFCIKQIGMDCFLDTPKNKGVSAAREVEN